ncbi:MAG: hypothetical protein R1F54_07665 [Candidatus Zeuxoniibacter abyssi]|nr:MAG: hypothetical protein R1F54_07665 [Candidatus Persebacteraceae bacterium AB1(2)]
MTKTQARESMANVLAKKNGTSFDNPDMESSWQEFYEIDECAIEEDKKPPSDVTKQTAEKMLRALCSEFPAYYAVYPDEHEGVAIQTSQRKGHSVLIVCEKNGRISCYLSRDHKNSRAHFDNHDIKEGLPNFIREALE